MDDVKATLEALGGKVDLITTRGQGTTTQLEVPITAAVQRVLLVGISGEKVALPITKVERIVAVIDRQEGAGENIAESGFEFDALFTKTDLGITA